MGNFKEIAKLVKEKRIMNNLSQKDISEMLGYKNPQMISNIERAKCSIPEKNIKQLSDALKIEPEWIVWAMIADYSNRLKGELK
jgi:transcriptional regulator with XRE-family HTH domain